MPMADATALRQSLAEFLGGAQYRKFIEQINRNRRMLFWQEQEWSRFTAAHPEFEVSPAELAVALRVCHLHGDELRPDTAELFHGCIDRTNEYCEAWIRLFPHASLDMVPTGGQPFEGDRIGVWFCPSCREARAAWEGSQPPGPLMVKAPLIRDWLVAPTTFRDYMDRFLDGTDSVSPDLLARFEQRAAEVAVKLRPGDELWEWHQRGGAFSSSGGLAVLRGGEVVEWWREWVS